METLDIFAVTFFSYLSIMFAVLAFFFSSRSEIVELPIIGKMSQAQAIQRRNAFNKSGKTKMMAIAHVIAGEQVCFKILAEKNFDSYKRTYSIDSSDKFIIL